MPNDEEEQDRLGLLHHYFMLIVGGDLFRAPITQIRQPQRILDMGTGTGIWAVDMADDFPEAEIVGVDLSPIQPSWAPSNCKFFIDDLESDWTFTREEAFDYIHGRVLAGGIADWERLLRQAYSHLKPGGWVEFQEYETKFTSDDGTHEKMPVMLEWAEKLDEASKRFGKRMNIAPELGRKIEEAGFVNVTDNCYKASTPWTNWWNLFLTRPQTPVGSWPKNSHLKEIGRMTRITVVESIEPYTLALFTRVLGYTYEETQEYMSKVRAEFLETRTHTYGRVHYVYAQRPMDEQ